MRKRSIFSKIFLNNIIVIIVSFAVLMFSAGWFLSETIKEDRDSNIEESARAIQGFIASVTKQQNRGNSGMGLYGMEEFYGVTEAEDSNRQIEHFLYGISKSSNKNILIVDEEGTICMASVNEQLFNPEQRTVSEEVIEPLFRGLEVELSGTLGDVYNKKMFTRCFPYINRSTNQVTCGIIISVPAAMTDNARASLFGAMLLIIGIVVLFACVLSYAISRRISKPIRGVGRAVKEFADGDFSKRIDTNDRRYNIREIQELANTFNDMAFRVEKAEDIRNNFISDVSHELRTPMTTISGFVDGIMDGTIPHDKQNEYLAIVKDEVSRLSALVNSFLDVTRNEKTKKEPELTHFDINEVIRRTVLNLESEIIRKKINVDIIFETDPCYVKADKNLIKSVLNNLTENAIKFTDVKGQMRIFVSTQQHEVQISVYNVGCGISEDDKPFIFERFYKGDKSRSRNQQGTGIGLYIVKDILGRHGKKIRVNSVEGEFAEFTFTLDKGKETQFDGE